MERGVLTSEHIGNAVVDSESDAFGFLTTSTCFPAKGKARAMALKTKPERISPQLRARLRKIAQHVLDNVDVVDGGLMCFSK